MPARAVNLQFGKHLGLRDEVSEQMASYGLTEDDAAELIGDRDPAALTVREVRASVGLIGETVPRSRAELAERYGMTEAQVTAYLAPRPEARRVAAASVGIVRSAAGAVHVNPDLNPLVAKSLDEAPQRVAASAVTAAVPTVFCAGDLPTFTASGIPVAALLEVPWQARHAMAEARTPAQAYEIHAACQSADAQDFAATEYGEHPGNVDYAARVRKWEVDSMTDAEVYKAMGLEASDRAIAEDRKQQDA